MQEYNAEALKDRNEALKGILQKEFGSDVRIVELHSEEAEDQDGDPIMRIWVVYEAEDNRLDRLDPDKVAAVVGPLRNRIRQLTNGLDRFPILSFMVPEEVGLASG